MVDLIQNILVLIETLIRIWNSRISIVVFELSFLSIYILKILENIDLTKEKISEIFCRSTIYRNYTIIYLIISFIVLFIWLFSRALPRLKKKEIGIVIAIDSENKRDGIIVRKDFIENIKNEILGIEDYAYKVIVLSSYHTKKICEKKSLVDKYHEITRAKLIIWGTSSIRKLNNEECYILSLNTSIYHGRIQSSQRKIIQDELNHVFPVENLIPLQDEYLGFKISSRCFAISSRYIIGIASFFSGRIELALKMHTKILAQISMDDNSQDVNIISRIRNNSKLFVLDEATIIARKHYSDGKFDEMEQYIKLIDAIDWDSYSSLLLKSIYYFSRDRDVGKALDVLERASVNRKDYTWAYNKAFLQAYKGNLDSAYKTYRTAFENMTNNDAHLQVESFILKIICEEKEKYQLHYCLGLLYMKKNENYSEAIKQFDEFIFKNEMYHMFDSSIEGVKIMKEKCRKMIEIC